jgi:hypothetical protein
MYEDNETLNDLNDLKLWDNDRSRYRSLKDYSTLSEEGTIEVIFRQIEKRLIEEIRKADMVFGCVAWLTSEPILNALAEKKGAEIIIQKEDFLRPDSGLPNQQEKKRRQRLRRLYNRIRAIEGHLFGGTWLEQLWHYQGAFAEAVRCVGNNNKDKQPAYPRAHHKFVVFARYEEQPSIYDDILGEHTLLVPEAVWTGSFNFTKNAGCSLENALIVRDKRIVSAYVNEFAQIAAVSEPLDWKTNWAEPQHFIGT